MEHYCDYETQDSTPEPETRLPNIADYDPMARLRWLEENDARLEEDNHIHHDLMNHAQECPETHVCKTGTPELRPCCEECFPWIQRLFGSRVMMPAKPKAA